MQGFLLNDEILIMTSNQHTAHTYAWLQAPVDSNSKAAENSFVLE